MLLFGLFICFCQSCIFSMRLSYYSFDCTWLIVLSEERAWNFLFGIGFRGFLWFVFFCQLFKRLVFLYCFLKSKCKGCSFQGQLLRKYSGYKSILTACTVADETFFMRTSLSTNWVSLFFFRGAQRCSGTTLPWGSICTLMALEYTYVQSVARPLWRARN